MHQPTQSLRLDLPDTLSGYPQVGPDDLEGLPLVAVEPESTVDDGVLLLWELV